MSCLSGYFGGLGYWENPSLMEALLRTPAKGAAAAFMPTGETTTDGQHILNTALFEALFNDDIRQLGPAIAAAKQTLLANGGDRYQQTSETFLLFGDPAMELKIPLPYRPDNLQGLWRLDGNVEFTWQPATDSNGDPVSGYHIYRSNQPGRDYVKLNTELLTAPEFIDTGIVSQRQATVTDGTTYYYTVTAVDADGDESPRSTEISPTLEPREMVPSTNAGTGSGGGGGGACFVSAVATAGASFFISGGPISCLLGFLGLLGLLWLGNHRARGRRSQENGIEATGHLGGS
jgi:hypothetical protein